MTKTPNSLLNPPPLDTPFSHQKMVNLVWIMIDQVERELFVKIIP